MAEAKDETDCYGTLLTRDEAACVDRAVHDLLGPDQRVVSVEKKKVTVSESEVIMVNGNPIRLTGDEGLKIKSCLLSGKLADYPHLLNQLLRKAGLIVTSSTLKADAEVRSSLTTRHTAKSNLRDHHEVVHEATEQSRSKNSRTLSYKQQELKKSASSEPPPKPGLAADIVMDGDQVVSGTLEELIHELVPRAHTSPSEQFQFAFLLSSRLFLTPTRLLHEVLRRSDQLSHMMSPSSHPAFVSNLVALLQRWMVSFPMDFRDESAMLPTKKLARLCQECRPPSETKVNQLLQTLHSHLQALERHERQQSAIKSRQRIIKSKKSEHPDGMLNCASGNSKNLNTSFSQPVDLLSLDIMEPVTFAQELTRLELEHLCFLGPEEVVNSLAKGFSKTSQLEVREAHEARERAATKTQNLKNYVDWFNRLSFLVATTVCQNPKKKLRVKIIEFWIEVARACIDFANFNSLMAIITGLNMTPVRRLRRTWLKIQGGKFTALEHQMDPTSNFLSYRSTFKAAISRSQSTTDKVQRIVIPFFSLLMKDLYFVNEECAAVISETGHLNFKKFLKLGEKLKEFAQWKDVECPYRKAPAVSDFLQLCPILSEEVLDFESFECENPELQEEKERYKMLKQRLKADS